MKNINFTPQQMKIINTTAPCVFVSACAGSGKTATLNARVRRLLDRGVRAERILVLSFSNASVKVLKSRLPHGVRIQTFHAFALDLVRKAAGSGAARPTLFSADRRLELLLKALSARKAERRCVREKAGIVLRSEREAKRLVVFFDRCNGSDEVAQRLVSDPESEFLVYAPVLRELCRIRATYDKLIERAGGIDYPSMLRRALRLVDAAPLPYAHLLVDEAQDMDDGQTRLLEGLAARIPNVMIFGDPNQAVFGFIGGKARAIRDVLCDVVTLPLTRSFRLTHENAELANAILGRGSDRIIGSRHGVTPSLERCTSAIAQEDAVVRLVEELKANGVPGDQIVILARTKAQLGMAEQASLARDHGTQPTYRPDMASHVTHVLDILALIEVCVRTARAGRKPKRIWRTRRLQEIAGTVAPPHVIAHCLRMLQMATRIPSFEGLYMLATRIYLRIARVAGGSVSDIATEIGRWEPIARRYSTATELRRHIARLGKRDAVVASTIHNAKGGEWDHVIVLGVTDGSIPFYREINRNDIAEERRLFYVAVTRARKQLHLFHAPYHHAPSRQTFLKPSRFLTSRVVEMLGQSSGSARRRLPAITALNRRGVHV